MGDPKQFLTCGLYGSKKQHHQFGGSSDVDIHELIPLRIDLELQEGVPRGDATNGACQSEWGGSLPMKALTGSRCPICYQLHKEVVCGWGGGTFSQLQLGRGNFVEGKVVWGGVHFPSWGWRCGAGRTRWYPGRLLREATGSRPPNRFEALAVWEIDWQARGLPGPPRCFQVRTKQQCFDFPPKRFPTCT